MGGEWQPQILANAGEYTAVTQQAFVFDFRKARLRAVSWGEKAQIKHES